MLSESWDQCTNTNFCKKSKLPQRLRPRSRPPRAPVRCPGQASSEFFIIFRCPRVSPASYEFVRPPRNHRSTVQQRKRLLCWQNIRSPSAQAPSATFQPPPRPLPQLRAPPYSYSYSCSSSEGQRGQPPPALAWAAVATRCRLAATVWPSNAGFRPAAALRRPLL